MASSAFLDTNVLVYAFDRSDEVRQKSASALVGELLDQHAACVSTQVVKELYVVTTRKIAEPLTHAEARAIIDELSVLTVVDETLPLLGKALDLCGRFQLSLWDACIVAAAAWAGCDRLYTEDLQDGQVIDGVRIVNPFAGVQK
jgi:predicted nucleic acid-binding protein